MNKESKKLVSSTLSSMREDSLFLYEHLGRDQGGSAIETVVLKYMDVFWLYSCSFLFSKEDFKIRSGSWQLEKQYRRTDKDIDTSLVFSKIDQNFLEYNSKQTKNQTKNNSWDSGVYNFLKSKDQAILDLGFGSLDESEGIYYSYLKIDEQTQKYLVFVGRYKSELSEDILDYIFRQYLVFKSQYNKLNASRSMLYIDEVTGVYNMRYLDMVLDSEIKRCTRFKEEFSLLFLDLDEFKKVNDSHGHLSGSSVLVQVAMVLKNSLRQIDSIVRYGGDEFVILLLNTNSKQAQVTAERLRSTVEQTSFYSHDHKFNFHLTVSIGIASFPKVDSKEKLLKIADEAMYMSKKLGKNQVVLWSEGVVEFGYSKENRSKMDLE